MKSLWKYCFIILTELICINQTERIKKRREKRKKNLNINFLAKRTKKNRSIKIGVHKQELSLIEIVYINIWLDNVWIFMLNMKTFFVLDGWPKIYTGCFILTLIRLRIMFPTVHNVCYDNTPSVISNTFGLARQLFVNSTKCVIQ